MTSLEYLNEKLCDAIYLLTVGEGDARSRLAQIIPKIMFHSEKSFPSDLQADFHWTQTTMKRGIGTTYPNIPPPSVLTGITNKTASKVIKKILFIQNIID